MDFWVYMLLCSDNTIYVGHTDNLEARIWDHRRRRYCGYTSKRLPVKVIFSETFQTREDAFTAERQIKGWTRAKKLALARGVWQLLRTLAVRRTPNQPRVM